MNRLRYHTHTHRFSNGHVINDVASWNHTSLILCTSEKKGKEKKMIWHLNIRKTKKMFSTLLEIT